MVIVTPITLNDTHPHRKTLGRTPLHEGSSRHNIHKKQTSLNTAGIEPAIQARPMP